MKIITDEFYEKISKHADFKEDSQKNTKNEKDFIPKSRFNEVNDKLKASNEKVGTYEKQLDETKKLLEGSTEYKEKYEALNGKYEADIQAKDKEIINTSKRFLVDQKLRESGARHTSLLMNQIDLEKISIENENLLGMDPILEGLKKDYEDLFETKKVTNNNSGSNENDDDDDDDIGIGDLTQEEIEKSFDY